MNTENTNIELIKVFSTDDPISIISYGPYDNGYFVVGFESGMMQVMDTSKLSRLYKICLGSPIIHIAFEPTL